MNHMPGDSSKRQRIPPMFVRLQKLMCFPLRVWAPSTPESGTQGVLRPCDTTGNGRWENSDLRRKEQKTKVRNNITNPCDTV